LHRRGLNVEDILASLRAVNEERCEPPKTEQELRDIARKIKERGYESGDLAGNGNNRAGSEGKPTHDELAQRFLSRYPHYAYGQSEWKKYGEGIWRPVPDALVERQILGVLIAAKVEEIKPTSNLLASVSKLARVVVAVPDEEWDADPDILVCTNGTLHVPTRELRPHDPGHHATSGVPYDHDSEAFAPTWGRFLGDFVDAETVHFLQEFTGYCLTTDVSHELALWLYGRPGGGRSTFIAGLEAMLGERAGTLGLGEIERSGFALSDVPGKTVLTATEQPAGFMKASYVLNSLISGDKLKVEEKFKPAYDVFPKAKLLWAMNELPRVPSANDGLFRRVKVIEIEPIPEGERDPKVKDAIKLEGAGILNWALDGLQRLRRRGGFEVPDAVRDATARWREMNDVPAMFVAEECETSEGKSVRATLLYYRYKVWCDLNGHKAKSRTHVAEDWRRLGFTSRRDKKGVVWQGVATKGVAAITLEDEE
jgi:putative DNA primase/helicase